MLLISEEIVTDTGGVRALRAELFQSLLTEMPLPQAAGQGRQKGTWALPQPPSLHTWSLVEVGWWRSTGPCAAESKALAAIPHHSPSTREGSLWRKGAACSSAWESDCWIVWVREGCSGYCFYSLDVLYIVISVPVCPPHLLYETCLTHHQRICSLTPDLYSVCKTGKVLPVTS